MMVEVISSILNVNKGRAVIKIKVKGNFLTKTVFMIKVAFSPFEGLFYQSKCTFS